MRKFDEINEENDFFNNFSVNNYRFQNNDFKEQTKIEYIEPKKVKEDELNSITNVDFHMTKRIYKDYRKKLIDRLTSKKNIEIIELLDRAVQKVTVTNNNVEVDIEV